MTSAPILLTLDSGTTAVKAAAFDRNGRIVASAERQNRALRRNGARVEQDMAATRDDALAVLGECVAATGAPVEAIIVTGQGDGLGPLTRDLEPAGPAIGWLDGRARGIVARLGKAGALAPIRAITGSRPTAASQSMQLLWLQENEPERLARIAHALRCKEWLFLALTGELRAEPSAVLPVWGDWRSECVSGEIAANIGLRRGIEFLPPMTPVGECRADLSAAAAGKLGLTAGTPVLLGPGDVQSSLIGLGLGVDPAIRRASIFGTSAIHACHVSRAEDVPAEPAGAIVQRFVLGEGYFCLHPCFNGGALLGHLARLFDGVSAHGEPACSPLIIHPFFEAGGERAPWTNPNATGAIHGLNATTSPAEIAWAGREALAFVARTSHAMMGGAGSLALGGGLADDAGFVRFLATVLDAPVRRSEMGHAGLRGLAAVGARFIYGESDVGPWLGAAGEWTGPDGAMAGYAQAKYALFRRSLDAAQATWQDMERLRVSVPASGKDGRE